MSLSFATLAAIACLFLVGLLPALHVSQVDPNALLKSSSGTGANRANRRRYGAMIVVQVALALPVLIGAVAVVRAAIQLRDPTYVIRKMYGYDPAPLVAAQVPVSGARGARVAVADVAARLTAHTRAVSDVLDATVVAYQVPDSQQVTVYDASGELRQVPAFQWSYMTVTPSYFRTFGRRMQAGRDFVEGESDGTSVIIDPSTAKFLFGDGNPIGRPVKFGHAHSRSAPWVTIVGVVDDLRDSATIAEQDFMFGRSLRSVYRVIGPRDSLVLSRSRAGLGFTSRPVMAYARVRGNTDLAAQRIERALRSLTPEAMPPRVNPIADDLFIKGNQRAQSFVAALFSVFALVGVSLVAVGVYGIVSHSVAERKRELAVRISLGATARDVLRSVMREGNVLLLAGTAAGLFLAMFTLHFLGGFMNWNDTTNSLLHAAIALALVAIAALAALVPALRATRIDPVEALRHE